MLNNPLKLYKALKTMNFTVTKSQLTGMLIQQNEYNECINPEWRNQEINWGRAIIVKAAAAINYYGWNVAGPTPPNLHVTRKHLEEIWKYILSTYLMENKRLAMTDISQIIMNDLIAGQSATSSVLMAIENSTDCERREIIYDLLEELIHDAATQEYCASGIFTLLEIVWPGFFRLPTRL